MSLFRLFTVAVAALTNVTNIIPTDTTEPQDNNLPFPVSHFTKTVASVHNTYCGGSANTPGVTFGDQTLLHALGNGDTVQRTNIYHSKSLGIIVAVQGTNVSSLVSISQDLQAFPIFPDPRLGLPLGSLVFAGWQVAWFNGWKDVRNALAETIKEFPNDQIIVTGHSQGAAISLLTALAIQKKFGHTTTIREIIAYGVPRVGNLIFANAFDSIFPGKYTGVVNGGDWVPSFPPHPIYQHPSGMVWINPASTTSWKYYKGQENPHGPRSRVGKIFHPNTLQFDWGDHQGIYMHSSMGTTLGPCPAQVGGF
ncbi:putative secretory lipase family 3 [Fusarium longipes]|uniref:Putative secretory lipase family 3 n=1 Tax=Fusarium longipes TaxID=694270 RepID=A0A395SWG3_9HYPO|nr:putative secretory lipase family 3 [Fusarium longipes]